MTNKRACEDRAQPDRHLHCAQGRVLSKETGAGIPDLVVSIHLADSPEEVARLRAHAADVAASWVDFDRKRLGTVLTDVHGSFRLTYDPECLRHRTATSGLVVVVSAAEDAGAHHCPRIIHVSCAMRANYCPVESFLIHVSAKQLRGAGAGPTSSQPSDDDALEALREREARRLRLADGMRVLTRERAELERRRTEEATKAIATPDRALSRFSPAERERPSYLKPGEDAEARVVDVVTNSIASTYDGAKRTVRMSFTAEQHRRLKQADGEYRKDIKGARFSDIAFDAQRPPKDVIRLSPLFTCRPADPPDEQCDPSPAARLPATSAATPPPTAPTLPLEGLTEDDLTRHLARLLGGIAAPEAAVQLDSQRATPEAVQAQVGSLDLKSGPADAPAVHEFHQMQIAFPHVWQESFDETTYRQLVQAYALTVNLTGTAPPASGGASLLDRLRGALELFADVALAPIPTEIVEVFDVQPEQWRALDAAGRGRLQLLAAAYLQAFGAAPPVDWTAVASSSDVGRYAGNLIRTAAAAVTNGNQRTAAQQLRKLGQKLLDNASARAGAGVADEYARLHYLIASLDERRKESYAFTHYAAGTVNVGIIVTYRQVWEPLSYQAGELARTITLAPKETRKFAKKVTLRSKRAEKEVRNNQSARRDESSSTARAESEVIRRANTKTNFTLNTDSTLDLAIASSKVSTGLANEAAESSEETKKDFREAVFKAAQEYKDERTLEVVTEAAEDGEVEESGEITNPNDELPVTFLFYELQRRYRISEKIHRVRPVLFVAQALPTPDQIDEGWLVANDWILRRAILDDSFLPALAYLATKAVGDELAIKELARNLELQRAIVEKLEEEIAAFRVRAGQRYEALERSIKRRADVIEEDDSEGFFEDVADFFVGDESPDAARIREDAAKDAYERASKEEKESRARLETAITALEAATETYAKAVAEHANRRAQIARLRVHVKDNILYYMQAIWSHEPPDQRFFRLHQIRAPRLTGQLTYAPQPAAASSIATLPHLGPPVDVEVRCQLDQPLETATLAELVDLDSLLGFKGNYMIFPLKEGNCLTDFMMVPYIDAGLGLVDPDDPGNWTLEEFARYVCCLRHQLPAGEFHELRDQLRRMYRRLLTNPRRLSDELVVPTGSLFIEALPGTHPILEDFKLKHRAVDLHKAQAEARRLELENLRLAARLLASELEDPEVDKQIVTAGLPAVVVPE